MNTPSPSRLDSRAGFTLPELLAVLVIAGILVAIAAPRLTGFLNQNRVEKALDVLAADVQMARATAVKENRTTKIRLTSSRRYVVFLDTGTGAATDTIKKMSLRTDFPGVAITVTPGDLTFDSRGLVTNGGATYTSTQSTKTRTLTVSGVGRIYRDY